MISKAIAGGLITFHGLCRVWSDQGGKFPQPEVLDAVLSSRSEWGLRFSSGYIDDTPLNFALNCARINGVNISRISLLGLAIVWGDTAAEEVIRKHCHLSNNEVSSVVELAGDEKKMLGDGEVREILKAYELCCLKKEHLSKLRELFVRYGVVKPHTDKKYFTPEVVTSLLRFFKFMGGYGELEWGVVEHSPAKPVPNLNNPVLGEKGILSKGSNVFGLWATLL